MASSCDLVCLKSKEIGFPRNLEPLATQCSSPILMGLISKYKHTASKKRNKKQETVPSFDPGLTHYVMSFLGVIFVLTLENRH